MRSYTSFLALAHTIARHYADGSHRPQEPSFASRLSEAAKRRSRWGLVRGWPLVSSHGCSGMAPQVGHGTANICFGVSSFARMS